MRPIHSPRMNAEHKGQANYQNRIAQDPKIMVGKPVVKGTRVPVELVLAKLARNPDLQELFLDYPRLTREDVQACLQYAETVVKKAEEVRRTEEGTEHTHL